MNRNSTLFTAIAVFSLHFGALATVYTDNGSSAVYNLVAGDSLSIASGTFTGTINSFPAGAKIAVQQSAVFNPTVFSFPDIHGTVYVYGTFKMSSSLRTNSNFTLYNYGVVTVNSTTQMSGSSQNWTNYYSGVMNFNGDVSMTNDNAIFNQGTINFNANLTMTGTTSITNRNIITVAGNYLNSGGTFTNQGRFEAKGSITFNNGQAIINNYCRMIAGGGINNTSGYVNNYNFIWAKAAQNLGNIVNSGTITNGPNAIIKAVTLNNTGTISGAGSLYFTGYTTTTNLGTTGVSGITSDTIRFYDASRTNALTIYDNQSGIVNLNVVYTVLSAPDTVSLSSASSGCAIELVTGVVLPIKWNYFTAAMQNEIPALNWSAQYDAGTTFEIQRSTDGKHFDRIAGVNDQNAKSQYYFNDESFNGQASIVYYRIKAIEPTGVWSYSETKTIRLTLLQNTDVTLSPNPFTTSFNINYTGKENGNISVEIFNLNGQQITHLNQTVHAGQNNILMTGGNKMNRGVYFLKVSQDGKTITTGKIIKQ